MTYAQFLTAFDPVLQAWPNKFPQVVLERIHSKVEDMTPTQMRHLCHEIIDRCDHAPRTSKVWELANLIRARESAGYVQPPEVYRPKCAFCCDLGVIRAIATNGSGETLMRCECSDDRDPANWALPRWTPQWSPLFSKEPCFVEWFKPLRIERDSKTGELKLESLHEKARAWRARVTKAEAFWVKQKAEAMGERA